MFEAEGHSYYKVLIPYGTNQVEGSLSVLSCIGQSAGKCAEANNFFNYIYIRQENQAFHIYPNPWDCSSVIPCGYGDYVSDPKDPLYAFCVRKNICMCYISYL